MFCDSFHFRVGVPCVIEDGRYLLNCIFKGFFELIFAVLRIIMPLVIELMKFFFSLLSLPMVHMLISMLISLMPISIVRGTWSDSFHISGWSMWQPNPELLGDRNTRSITELESCRLSANLVGPGLVGGGNSSPKLLAKVKRSSVRMEW